MKTKLLITAIVCLTMATVQAAHLEVQNGGGLWGQVDRYIDDSETEIPSSPMPDAGSTSASANHSGSTGYSSAVSSMSGEVTSASYWGEGVGTAITLNASAESSSTDSTADVWSYGNVATLVPASTDGIFFVIKPDEGETAGTPIWVQWRWSAQANTIYGDAQSSAGSGTMYITRNVMPPTGTPDTGIVWSRGSVTFTEPGAEAQTGSFAAQIGDVIGVFFTASANTNLTGEGSSAADITTSIEILADQALPTLLEYPYAPGLVYDPDQNITFLKDWSTVVDPMNWDDANDLAQNFIYTSNGVTYSNWRLPTTTDEQGATVGELGYLASNYGISFDYSGPFTNMSDGDYWTSPQFSRDPDDPIAYAFTFSTTFGPAQWWSWLDSDCYFVPVFDGPPTDKWCPADFDNNGIVDFSDFATFASYWLNEKPR